MWVIRVDLLMSEARPLSPQQRGEADIQETSVRARSCREQNPIRDSPITGGVRRGATLRTASEKALPR